MKNTSKIITGLLIVLLTFSCSKDDSPAPTPTPVAPIVTDPKVETCNTTIPYIKVGYTAVYSNIAWDKEVGTDTHNYTSCDDKGIYRTRNLFDVGTGTTQKYTDLIKLNGDYVLVDSNNNGDYFVTTYKHNGKLGDKWEYTKPSGAKSFHEIIKVDSTVTVPAGTFKCKVVKYWAEDIINETYSLWNDEVGLVQTELFFSTVKLKSYKK